MDFIEELKRRKVVRVGLTYAVAAWVVLQVAALATESFAAPAWIMKLLLTLSVLGFFAAISISWAFEWTASGIHRDVARNTEESLPEVEDKKLVGFLAAGLLVAIVLLVTQQFSPSPDATADPPKFDSVSTAASVAVLPFVNMSGNKENEYFSDGLTETLLHMLAQVKDLKVAARTSSFAFKGLNTDIREIARQLDVANVLEGSVQRAGDTVRITAQLIRADNGYHLWSQTFDRRLDDIFSVQDEISREVARALSGSLLQGAEASTPVGSGTRNPEAYDLYLRGREAYWQEKERSALESERLMRRAIALDPEFSLAWSGLAETMMQHLTLSGGMWEDINEELLAAARKGVELAPNDSNTLSVLGEVLRRSKRDLAQALPYLERAVQLNPNNAWALSRLAHTQFGLGEFRASVETASRAMAIDPLDFNLKTESVHKFFNSGRFQEAEMLAQAVIENNPDSVTGMSSLGNIYWRSGRYAKALAIYQKMLAINPNTIYLMGRIAQSYRDVEDNDSVLRWLGRAETINPEIGLHNMAGFCEDTGQDVCAIENIQALMKVETDQDDRLNLEARLARLQGRWQDYLDYLTGEIQVAESRSNQFYGTALRIDAALAADRLGLEAQRDDYARAVLTGADENYAQGSRVQYLYINRAEAYAIIGDAARCHEALAEAIAQGYRDVPEIEHTGYFDKVLDDPAMQQLITELRASNQVELKAMLAIDTGE